MKEATLQELVSLLCSSFNCFEMDFQLQKLKIDQTKVETRVEEIIQELTPEESKLVMQSREAFLQIKETVMPEEEREASVFNRDIVSESEQDDPDDYLKQNHKPGCIREEN